MWRTSFSLGPLRASARSRSAPPWGRVGFRSSGNFCSRLCCSRCSAARPDCFSPGGVPTRWSRCGPADLPRLREIRVNGVVVAFTFGIACLTSLIFGLIPALQASRPEVEQSLKEAARGSTGGTRAVNGCAPLLSSRNLRSRLVLLVGAGLLIRSFAQLRAVQPGFDARRCRHSLARRSRKRATARSISKLNSSTSCSRN